VFCPNCGTKNADTEAKCAQCGFDLQAKAPQARFKGTMVMNPGANPLAQGSSSQGSPGQPPAAPAAVPAAPAKGPAIPGAGAAAAASKSSLKGTMIGMAPPEMQRALEEAKAKAASLAASAPATGTAATGTAAPAIPAAVTPKPSLKGTMIGVAPPDMQAAIAAAKAKVAGGDAAPSTSGPAASAGGPATAAPATAAPIAAAPATTKPSIKGTMIGVAPPDMAAAMAAHKAELEKRAAAAAQPAAPPAPAAAPDAPKTSSPLARSPNSKLKGTMIGVAPPDVSQAIAGAKAVADTKASEKLAEARLAEAKASAATPRDGVAAAGRPMPNPDLGATMVGTAAPIAESLRPARTSERPPSGEFKGTMSGATSPLVQSDGDAPDSRAAGNSDHPAAFASTSLSAVAEIAAARENLQRALAEAEAAPKPPTGRDIPTGAQSPAALRSAAQGQGVGPARAQKSSALPVVLLGVALLVVAILIGIALLNRPKAPDAAEKTPAPAAP